MKTIYTYIIIVLSTIIVAETLAAFLVSIAAINPDEILIVDYLKPRPALYKLDPNGSPVYVSGFRGHRDKRRHEYDRRGYLISDVVKIKNPHLKKIGFFGDSYLEGLKVSEDQTFTSLYELENKKRNNFLSVFNFGVGGTGTYHQYLRYKTISSNVNLDHVVLFFLPQNDVLNNHPILGKPFELSNAPYFGGKQIGDKKKSWGEISLTAFKRYIAKNSFIARVFYGLFKKLEILMLEYSATPSDVPETKFFSIDRLSWFGVFREPGSSEWKEAWQITEDVILRFNDEVNKNGQTFTIVIVADSLQIFHDKDKKMKQYDFKYPNNRLMNFCTRERIRCLNSLPFFLDYKDKKNLQFPFFSWKDDGHYASLGNRIMAKFLLQHLNY